MISESSFSALFGATSVQGTADDKLVYVAREAVKAGYAIVPCWPGTKKPMCTLNSRDVKTADALARENARLAGHRRWENVKHECGIKHAITDATEANRIIRRLAKNHGAINLGVELGRSRVVVVDVDTDAEGEAFRASWMAAVGLPLSYGPTVRSPGVVDVGGVWKHKNGGHYWFTVPEHIDLPTSDGKIKDPTGWVAMWSDCQVLVPPSVRDEGPYELIGDVHLLPEWILKKILVHAIERKRRMKEQAQRRAERLASGDGEASIDAWSAATPWSEILEPDGWYNTTVPDSCGCDIWTAPGVHGSPKSATAHDVGCADPHYDDSNGHLPIHVWTYNPPEHLAGTKQTFSKIQYMARLWNNGDEGPDAIRSACRELGIPAEGGRAASPLVALALNQAQQALVTNGSAPPDPLAQPSEASGPALGVLGQPPMIPLTTNGSVPSGTASMDQAPDHKDPIDKEIEDQFRYLLVREKAKVLFSAYQAAETELPAALMSGDEFLAGEDMPIRYMVSGLWPAGGNIMLAAQRKTGKTTLLDNLTRSLLDGSQFLNRFAVEPPEGVIARIDLEMDTDILRADLRRQKVSPQGKLFLKLLRGEVGKFNITDDRIRAHWATLLSDVGTSVLLFDCLRPLMDALGLDENREIGIIAQAFDQLKLEAGIPNGLVAHHAGHDAARSRGDSRARDWPDAEWFLARSGDDDRSPRKFSAYGRAKIDVAPTLLAFDHETNWLTIPSVGLGASASTVNPEICEEIVKILAPLKETASTNEVIDAMVGKAGKDIVRATLNLNTGKVFLREKGPKRSWQWSLASSHEYFVPKPEPENYEGPHSLGGL